jgi:hypothetical protein
VAGAKASNKKQGKGDAADAAEKTGVTERTIRNRTRIGEALGKLAEEIRGTSVEDSQSDLLELTKIKPYLTHLNRSEANTESHKGSSSDPKGVKIRSRVESRNSLSDVRKRANIPLGRPKTPLLARKKGGGGRLAGFIS